MEERDSDHLRNLYKLLTEIDNIHVQTENKELDQFSFWMKSATNENRYRVFVCLRILLRDDQLRLSFHEFNGTALVVEHLQTICDFYLMDSNGYFIVDIIKEVTNILQKLSTDHNHCQIMLEYGALKSLVILLAANDVIVLHCTLHALISISHYDKACLPIIELNAIETLLTIIQDYDILSKKLAASLLRFLCIEEKARIMIKSYDGIPLLLSLLHNDNVRLLWNIVWILVHLAADVQGTEDIRRMGGIPLLLSLLHDKDFVSDRSSANGNSEESPPSEGIRDSFSLNDIDVRIEEVKEHTFSLKSACCACLTELSTNETNAQQITRCNGIYLIAKLLISTKDHLTSKQITAFNTLQSNVLRTLRFLFSMQRYRKQFKRLFPSDLFEIFIDIGHYRRDIALYENLATKLIKFNEEEKRDLDTAIRSTDHEVPAKQIIGEYELLELLGSGAFGSVYRCHKVGTGPVYQALKEINTTNAAWGKTNNDRAKSIGTALCELSIIKEQLRHPNVVRYYKAFAQNDKLYIVMELLEGIPLAEHFNYCKEKNECISEDRVWKIFIQITLALKYLHKQKKIVHRDLTPNNIMLGESDKITITDFGLAKQKQTDCSKMTSVVGTILYSCPEIIQSQPYGPKSDIWSLGCIIYNTCALQPPFYGSNMLSLATKIVEADYEPLCSKKYSEKLLSTIYRCLTSEVDQRPDILGVVAMVSERLVDFIEVTRGQQIEVERKLQQEQRRTQRNYCAANQSMQDYHRLFLVSQERYDKLVNLASSGGAAELKVFGTINERREQDLIDKIPVNNGIVRNTNLVIDSSCSESSSSSRQRLKQYDSGHESCGTSRDGRLLYSEDKESTTSETTSKNNVQRSLSQPSLRSSNRIISSSSKRPNTATTATLTISQDKVREIHDPIQQMLHQLHKIIYISQLPPTLVPNPRRHLIERFKRALFDKQTNSFNLKNEMQKILTCSRDVIDLNYGPVNSSALRPRLLLKRQLSANVGNDEICDEIEADNVGVTYEQINSLIEGVLVQYGYYDIKS